jgi:hypothetical protein
MIDVPPEAISANGRAAIRAARPATRIVHLWLIGLSGALVLTLCSTAFLLWGLYGPAYILDLIAAYCG